MIKRLVQVFAMFVVLFIVAAWWYIADAIKNHSTKNSGLPYYGPDTLTAEKYQVDKFTFVNQYSDTITRKEFEDKIWVTDFFFSTCEGICPIMTFNLSRVQDTFRGINSFKLLSHTVDPKTDDVNTLYTYAQKHRAEKGQWHFVTGDASEIYRLARYSYFVATPKDSTYDEDFVHSQLIALIDPHLHIRGFYDGTNGKDIEKLIVDIRKLQLEYPKTMEAYRKKSWLDKIFQFKSN